MRTYNLEALRINYTQKKKKKGIKKWSCSRLELKPVSMNFHGILASQTAAIPNVLYKRGAP